MYLAIEQGIKVGRAIVAGLSREESMRVARRLCKERGAAFRVRDTETNAVLYTFRPESIVRRKACDCPSKCFGSRREQHTIKCRPARPACRWRRREVGQAVCDCPAYRFPHRANAGDCNPEKRNARLWGPSRAA